jgi:aspartate racemase
MIKDRMIIGMIGGTGWVSTAEYYRLINEKVNQRTGGRHFARCLLYSLDYFDIGVRVEKSDYEGIYNELILDAARKLHAAGAGCLVLCANTLHMYVSRLEMDVPLPIIHIAEATALRIKNDDLSKVGLLGTKLTMEGDFYHSRLNSHGIEALIPGDEDRDFIDSTIRKELVRDIFKPEANARFLEIISALHDQGAEAVILGCTEIPLLVKPEQTPVKLYDTTEIHAEAVVQFCVGPL